MSARTILHVDLDAFYASVEQRDDPTLRGKPIVVAGPPPRGVVAAASYEARRFGVKSAMPTAQAMARCRELVVLPPRIGYYATVSAGFFDVLRRYSPLVEGLSLDEAFVDATGAERLFGDGPAIAKRIKSEVREELSLVASVGVAPSKFVAKVASDLGKPDGLLVVEQAQVVAFLAPLPLGRLWGVGEVTERELSSLGLRTIGDVAALGPERLALRIGLDRARHLCALAVGDDPREVVADRAAVSVGSEETFARDLRERGELRAPILAQADRACARLRKESRRARTVTLKVKYADHTLVSRRTTLARPTTDPRVVGDTALALLAEVPAIEARGVRLVGVTLSHFEADAPERQQAFSFDAPSARRDERGEKLGEALDAIAAKFGRGAIKRAVHVDDDRDPDAESHGPLPPGDADRARSRDRDR